MSQPVEFFSVVPRTISVCDCCGTLTSSRGSSTAPLRGPLGPPPPPDGARFLLADGRVFPVQVAS